MGMMKCLGHKIMKIVQVHSQIIYLFIYLFYRKIERTTQNQIHKDILLVEARKLLNENKKDLFSINCL